MMKCYRTVLFVFLVFFVISGNAHSYLKTRGDAIVDLSGNEILLRGYGLGGWLVPEGYQLHVPGYGSPSSIRQKIVDLIGEKNARQFFQKYVANYVTEEDIQQIASWGFNSIRLPFNYRMLSAEDQSAIFMEDGFQIIDQVLAWCKKYSLYLILDMHCAPGGQNKDNISDSDGIEARLWTEQHNQDKIVSIWRQIADRYANEQMIGGYDLINETVLPQGVPNTTLRALFMRITRAIREVDTNHIIFIEGNWYATDFTNLTPPWDNNMVYSFHKYWNENSTTSIQNYLNIRKQYHVPLWLGETGENSNPWFYECVQLMEENNIGWNWWTHKKIQTVTSPYSAPIGLLYQKVLDYWNGNGPKPPLQVSIVAMNEMAENLLLKNCQHRPGVLKALLDPNFNSNGVPFKENLIPGIIHAVDYDIGHQGISYYDHDYQNIAGPGGAQWNKGWQYRNDGVDIEVSEDADSTEYSIGWIEQNEWMLYSVKVEQSGTYSAQLRIASPNSTGKLQMSLNGKRIFQLSVINTGGWKNWRTITAEEIYLPKGDHQLKISFPNGGFNFNFVRFQLIEASLEDKQSFSPISEYVYAAQNYPNPFNQKTSIPLFLIRPTKIELNIYNSLGSFVKEIFTGMMSAGQNRIIWDGTDSANQLVSSGLYFCRFHVEGSYQSKSMIFEK